ncbi:MAG TPA: ubiquinol-cytochrome c reductase iron-sulfur subunit [Micropepsaceae bacterium]|nr:ubiquinol-cytochrome c reductase iron-sulfur subunit [Micropepsaceae bacterium]
MAHSQTEEPTRRDFLYIATAAVGAVGAATTLIPLIGQMNPSADVLALASIEIDLTPIMPGQSVTFTWRSHPLFVRRRTPDEIAAARAVKVQDLLDPVARNASLPDNAPATDENRIHPSQGAGKPEWLVLVGVCTHLGCTPEASTAQSRQGDYGGWLCHCHGSQYDQAGRVRVGPAPRNLDVPNYAFLSDTRIKVG